MDKFGINLIESFVRATFSCFETMMDTLPVHVETSLEAPPMEVTDLCAIIGLSGDGRGIVGLAMSKESAVQVVSRFIGEEITEVNKNVFDAVGELINIIAGDAKSSIEEMSLSISLPTILSGSKLQLSLPEALPNLINLHFELPDMNAQFVLFVGLVK